MFIVNNEEFNDKKIEVILEKTPNLEEVFFKNINNTKKPIIIIDKQNGEIMYQKKIKEKKFKKKKKSKKI